MRDLAELGLQLHLMILKCFSQPKPFFNLALKKSQENKGKKKDRIIIVLKHGGIII